MVYVEDLYAGEPWPSPARRWALMAIDVAGNTSDVVLLPSGKRVAAPSFPGPETLLGSDPAPASAAVPVMQAVAPPAAAPPAQPKPRGCGCEVPGGVSAAPFGLLCFAALLWRRRDAW